jgi:hypothetical protein
LASPSDLFRSDSSCLIYFDSCLLGRLLSTIQNKKKILSWLIIFYYIIKAVIISNLYYGKIYRYLEEKKDTNIHWYIKTTNKRRVNIFHWSVRRQVKPQLSASHWKLSSPKIEWTTHYRSQTHISYIGTESLSIISSAVSYLLFNQSCL